MFKCDATTRAELDAAQTQSQWATILNAALGTTRRIVCKRDPASNAADPWTTGTTFRDIASTGALRVAGGKVAGLGRIKGSTVKLPASMSTGTSVLRVTGNNRFIEVSIGMVGNNPPYDLETDEDFTTTNGLAIKPNFAISGPMFLPSGTGPVAPDLDADAPVAFRVMDWTNPSSPVAVGTAQLSVRDLNMVADIPAVAAELGDIRVNRVPDGGGVVMGAAGEQFRFAVTLLTAHKGLNATNPNKPVYQAVVHASPHNRWASFPFRKDFDINNDLLAPKNPFKIELLKANGTIAHTFEMYSTQVGGVNGTGKAINHADQTIYVDYTKPCQPFWTCQMSMLWTSTRLKPSSKLNHYLTGVDADSMDDRNVAAFDASPEQWPIITGNYLANGLGSWKIAPKWSRPRNAGMDTSIVDPYFSQPSRDEYITQWIGWGYEPGSTCHHTWFMSPGGSRHDRAPFPHAVVKWATNPTGNRLHGNTPMSDMIYDGWMPGYFNEGCWYNPQGTLERFESIPKSKILNGEVCYNDTYYNGGNENFRPDIQNNAIRLLTAMNAQHENWLVDKYGRQFVNQYQRDDQHNISNGALGVYLANSPAHMLAARATFNSAILCGFGMSDGTFNKNDLLTRQHAWHMWQHANMWMATSNDPRLISKNELEAMWARHLHAVYDNCVPEAEANLTVWAKMLNGFGMHGSAEIDTVNKTQRYFWATDPKAFYMAQTFMFMKQSGSWDAMKNYSEKCRKALEMMLVALKKFSVDCFLDANAINETQADWQFASVSYTGDTPPQPTWANYPAKNGQIDWIRNPDGTLRVGQAYIEYNNTQHLRAQCVWIIQRFFAEYNLPRVAEAVTKVDELYSTVKSNMVAGTGNQWHWRFTNFGKFNAPAVVGAPV